MRFNPLWHSLFIIISLAILVFQLTNKNVTIALNSNVLFVLIPVFLLASIQILFEVNIWHQYFKAFKVSYKSTLRIVFESYLTKITVAGAAGELITRSVYIDKIDVKSLLRMQFSHSLHQTISSLLVSALILFIASNPDSLFLSEVVFYGLISAFIVVLLTIVVVLTRFNYISSSFPQKFYYLGRVLVYFAQFAVCTWILGPSGYELHILGGVALYFILKTVLPIYNFAGGIGLRELSLYGIFTFLKIDPSSVLISSLVIWSCNHLLPVLLTFVYNFRAKWSTSFSAQS